MNGSEQDFSFVDDGRTFTCHVDASRPHAGDAWWWFAVSTERHQRHAPFRANADDTRLDIQARVVAYYDDLLARRAAPRQTTWQRRERPKPPEGEAP